jgi:hypothetical protein
MAQRNELVIALELGKREFRRPARGLDRDVPRALQFLHERPEVSSRGHAVEPAHADVHGVDLAPAEQAHQRIPGFLQGEPAPHRIAMLARHLDRVRIAQKIRRMQHHHVQRVALDPFAAIEKPPQRPERAGDCHAERILHRVHRAHLVGDRADAADARRDVGRLGAVAPAQQRLEKPRRLENPEMRPSHAPIPHVQIERALALDPGDGLDADRPSRHEPRSLSGTRVRRH